MNLLNRLFKKAQHHKNCPRCLGKGNVDWDDIKRLNKELKWIPGTCAYCNGSGKVDLKIEDKIAFDTTYLVTNLSKEERKKIIEGNMDAIERARLYENQVNDFIAQISYLYFEAGLTPIQIAKFYLITLSKKQYLNYGDSLRLLLKMDDNDKSIYMASHAYSYNPHNPNELIVASFNYAVDALTKKTANKSELLKAKTSLTKSLSIIDSSRNQEVRSLKENYKTALQRINSKLVKPVSNH